MANVFLANKNHLKSTYANVVISGGDWSGYNAVINTDLYDVAISNGDGLAATQLQFDLGELRDVRVFAIPDNVQSFNVSKQAKHRIRASNTPKWSGLQIDGNVMAGVNVLPVANVGAASVTVAAGDAFSIISTLPSGQIVRNTYEATASATIAAGASGTLNIAAALVVNATTNQPLDCNHGDFTTPLYLCDWEDITSVIYPWGTLPWGNPAFVDGKITTEQFIKYPNPVVKVFDLVVARYWIYEIDDFGGRPWNAPNIHIPYVFIGNGYQPKYNAAYSGTNFAFESDTTIEKTIGGRRIYGNSPVARKFAIALPDTETDEAFSEPFDMAWIGGLSSEIMFIFDPEDIALMSRRSFLCNLEALDPLTFPYFARVNISFQGVEII
jgi:hypothetical protein